MFRVKPLGPGCTLHRRYCGQHTLFKGWSRTSRATCLRVRLRPQCVASMSAPYGERTQPLRRASRVEVPQNHLCLTVYGVGGHHKTTAPSSSDHRVPGACSATVGGILVLPDKYRKLGDDFRKSVSSFSAMTGSTAKPSVLRQSTAFGRISNIFYMTVDTDLEVDSRSVLLVFSVVQTTSEVPTLANPLSFLDQNTDVVAKRTASVGMSTSLKGT